MTGHADGHDHVPLSGAVLDQPLGYYAAPAAARLREQLAALEGCLGAGEGEILAKGGEDFLLITLRPKLQRLLLLELHSYRMSGELSAPTSQDRWQEFLDLASGAEFWRKAERTYPALGPRIARVTSDCVAAMAELARRFAGDRDALAELLPGTGTDLVGVRLNLSDRHNGNRCVAVLRLAGGSVVYKPRPADTDIALARALGKLAGTVDAPIRVPRVLSRGDYSWAEFEQGRFCADTSEQQRFYQGLGRWLAVMALLGGTDLHAENILACGPVPVVIDCETLFELDPPRAVPQFGDAFNRASAMIGSAVLRTGIVPARFSWLGLRGVDVSAAGLLPGQQPTVLTSVIADAGTDQARMVTEPIEFVAPGNHPVPAPTPQLYWDDVVAGFRDQAAAINALDRAGQLAGIVESFRGCRLRAVPRATQTYAEFGDMLWHPASLHDEMAATARVREVLQRQGAELSGVQLDAQVIEAEIADLLAGDIPVFSRRPECARVSGPGGTEFGECRDLLATALTGWRERDLVADETAIKTSLVGAFLMHAAAPGQSVISSGLVSGEPVDERRRRLAAQLAGWLCDTAITGADGTAAWIGVVYTGPGFGIQVLAPNLYSGQAGVAVALAAYLAEYRAGRADPVDGLAEVTERAVTGLAVVEGAAGYLRSGGLTGLGSAIWAWLTLDALTGQADGPGATDGIAHALRLAEEAPQLLADEDMADVLDGAAGLIVPLIGLADRTGDPGMLDLAAQAAGWLEATAQWSGQTACWPRPGFPVPSGGFAHGTAGIGWALARLALVTGSDRWHSLAQAAFRYTESLYSSSAQGWKNVYVDQYQATWCNGSTGIGLAACDLHRRSADPSMLGIIRRAASATWREGFGQNQSMCHGDMGSWEFLSAAATACSPDDQAPAFAAAGQATLDGLAVASAERVRPAGEPSSLGSTPGLLPGIAGVIYQLLRIAPESSLPSVLLLAR